MGFRERFREWLLRVLCPSEFLCDNCKYDHPAACAHRERPNAVKCPDYHPKTGLLSSWKKGK